MSIGVSIVEDDAETREILAGWIKNSNELRLVSNYETGERAAVRLPSDNAEMVFNRTSIFLALAASNVSGS